MVAAASSGEFALAWADSSVLIAVAEQLDVDLPAETEARATSQQSATAIAKTKQFVELGSEAHVQDSLERADTYRRASDELRLARVLRGLLLQDRLRDALFDVVFELVQADRADRAFASRTDEPVAALVRDIDYMNVLSGFRDVASKLVKTHEWVVIDGGFHLVDEDSFPRLVLRTYFLGAEIEFPSKLNVSVPFGRAETAWTDRFLTPWGSRRLVSGERLDLTVFAFAHQFAEETNDLVLAPVAVFERIAHSGSFKWSDVGRALREQPAQEALPVRRPRRPWWRL